MGRPKVDGYGKAVTSKDEQAILDAIDALDALREDSWLSKEYADLDAVLNALPDCMLPGSKSARTYNAKKTLIEARRKYLETCGAWHSFWEARC